MLVTTRYTISNPYLYVSGVNGIIDVLAVDPSGSGSYAGNIIKSGHALYMSLFKDGMEVIASSASGTWAVSGSTLTISDVPLGSTGIAGDWTIELNGDKLESVYTLKNTSGSVVQFSSPGYKLVTPFERDGFDVTDNTKILFSHFITDKEQYIDMRGYKRLTEADTLDLRGGWIHAFGTNGYDLRFAPQSGIISPHNTADSQTLRFVKFSSADTRKLEPAGQLSVSLDIRVFAPGMYTIPDSYPIFRCSDAEVADALNAMFYERCFGWPGDWAPPSIWKELTMIEKSFLNSDVREQERISLLNTQMDPDGTVFTWGSQKYYATGTNHTFFATTSWVNGCARYFFATGDTDFLDLIMPRLRLAMQKLLTYYSATDSIFILNDGIHLGASYQNGSSNLWDGVPFGYKDAYNNIYCYTALLRMADLEHIAGNGVRASELRDYAADVRTGFNSLFWDGDKFIQCIDINGTVRDYEMSAINLEAIANGLVDPSRASDIIDYFANIVTPSGYADVFTKWAIGPRVLALDNPVKASGGWWVYQYDPSLGYDNVIMGGGTTLWLGYYELMARLVGKDADDAYARLDTILTRFLEPDHMSGGNPLYRGEVNQHGSEGNVGVWGEFPESGVFPTVALYGFMGVRMDKDGLHVTPNLPAALTSLAIDRFDYWGMNLSIDVTATSVRIRAVANGSAYSWTINGTPVSGTFDSMVPIAPGQTVTLQRSPNNAFDLGAITPDVYKLKAGLSADIVMKAHTSEFIASKQLQNGLNVISLPAPGFIGYTPTAPDGTGAVIAEVTLPDGSKLYTDSSWKASDEAPGNPDDPAYDDTGWANAVSYGGYGVGPWNTLISGMSGTPARWIWTAANRDEYAPAAIAAASASSEAYSADYAKDGHAGSCWSSLGHFGPDNTEWLRMDLGMERDVRGVMLTPRQDIPGACFPIDFAIQTSIDGSAFTTVSGHRYAAYPNPGADSRKFLFTDPVRARYVRVLATKLSATGGIYYCQLAELAVLELQYAPTWVAARKLEVSAVTASSTFPGYAGNSLIDGNLGSGWSSAGHPGANYTEHVTLDLGYTQSVGAVILNPIYNGAFFPENFAIQYSTNGASWTTVPGQSHTGFPVQLSSVDIKFVFSTEVQARYIRIEATKLRGDGAGNYYFQMNEAAVFMGSFGAFASSSEPWGPAGNVTDKDSWDSFFTLWSSNGSGSESSVQWIAIDMKSVRRVDYLIVQPQYYGDFFPKDFKFQASDDGSTWTDIPGASYTDYPKPGINFSNVQQFEFINPVHTRYIRMYATKLSIYPPTGTYYFQLASLAPMRRNTAYLRKTFYTGVSSLPLSSAVASSSAGTGYEASQALDGSDSSSWSSAGHADAAVTEWLYVDTGAVRTIKQIALKPGAAGCFPVAFKLQYSSDASNWTDIPGLSYSGYGDPGKMLQTYAIRTPVSARYIRLYITELRAATNGSCYAQIAEMQLQG